MSASKRAPARLRLFLAIVLVAALLAAAADLFGPVRTDIRVFEPDEVARLDTEMWRAYYDRRPLPLFLGLAELMRLQFHFPFLRSYVAAARAARAAFVFKDGKDRADYERALPDLMAYYGAIRAVSTTTFDVRRAAETELEWWIVHRERERLGADSLARALAEGAAALYGIPADSLMDYGRLRTDAMVVRDTTAASGGVREADWGRIYRDLRRAWGALAGAVRPS